MFTAAPLKQAGVTPFFLRGHVDALAFFGGVRRVLLYDNVKSAVLERHGDIHRAEVIDIEADSYRLKEAKELTVARTKQRSKKPSS